jgi:hypothetical protein
LATPVLAPSLPKPDRLQPTAFRMAIQIEANYSKKLGLPGYSSHQYSITLRMELADVSQVSEQSEKIHTLLQSSVDREIQKQGYLPTPQPAPPEPKLLSNGNGNGHQNHKTNGSNGHYQNGYRNHQHRYQPNRTNGRVEQWKCSPKQQELILKITNEQHLDKNHVEDMAQQMFGKGVIYLNKLEASGLIDELVARTEAAGGRQ